MFLKKLKNITDPEHKRKVIGSDLFIEVFSKYIRKLEQKDFLGFSSRNFVH